MFIDEWSKEIEDKDSEDVNCQFFTSSYNHFIQDKVFLKLNLSQNLGFLQHLLSDAVLTLVKTDSTIGSRVSYQFTQLPYLVLKVSGESDTFLTRNLVNRMEEVLEMDDDEFEAIQNSIKKSINLCLEKKECPRYFVRMLRQY